MDAGPHGHLCFRLERARCWPCLMPCCGVGPGLDVLSRAALSASSARGLGARPQRSSASWTPTSPAHLARPKPQRLLESSHPQLSHGLSWSCPWGPLSSAPVPSHGPCTSSPSSAAQAVWPEPSVLASLGLSSLVAANRKAVPGGVRVWGGQLPWNSEGAQLAGTAGHWEPGGAWQHCVGCRTSSWGRGPPCPVPVFPAWRLVRTACRAHGPHAGRVGTAAVFRGGDQGPRKPKASAFSPLGAPPPCVASGRGQGRPLRAGGVNELVCPRAAQLPGAWHGALGTGASQCWAGPAVPSSPFSPPPAEEGGQGQRKGPRH